MPGGNRVRAVPEAVDEQGDHRVRARGVIGSRREDAEFRDRGQQVDRVDAVADRAGGDGGVKEGLEDRAELLLEVRGQSIATG